MRLLGNLLLDFHSIIHQNQYQVRQLIYQNKATLLENPKDIPQYLGWTKNVSNKKPQIPLFVELTNDEQLIVVRERLKSDHKRELIIHELLHVCLEDIGYQQSQYTEELITILAPRINALLDEHIIKVIDNCCL